MQHKLLIISLLATGALARGGGRGGGRGGSAGRRSSGSHHAPDLKLDQDSQQQNGPQQPYGGPPPSSQYGPGVQYNIPGPFLKTLGALERLAHLKHPRDVDDLDLHYGLWARDLYERDAELDDLVAQLTSRDIGFDVVDDEFDLQARDADPQNNAAAAAAAVAMANAAAAAAMRRPRSILDEEATIYDSGLYARDLDFEDGDFALFARDAEPGRGGRAVGAANAATQVINAGASAAQAIGNARAAWGRRDVDDDGLYDFGLYARDSELDARDPGLDFEEEVFDYAFLA